MTDRASLPEPTVAEELRRIIAARRRRLSRLRLLLLAGMGAVPAAATIGWKPPTLILWNASPSAPVGLYLVRPGAAIRRGDLVVAWAPGPARDLAARRHYLPANLPLVKRVAASAGDQVCALGETIQINGRPTARRGANDPAGRPMPWWSGCRALGPGEHLLLMDSPLSFDGRYFGPTGQGEIVGRARLVWATGGQGRRP